MTVVVRHDWEARPLNHRSLFCFCNADLKIGVGLPVSFIDDEKHFGQQARQFDFARTW